MSDRRRGLINVHDGIINVVPCIGACLSGILIPYGHTSLSGLGPHQEYMLLPRNDSLLRSASAASVR
mgnify:CR=1 FL=1|jgi:hypothetical protein